jgi:hypothetical protein
MLGYSDQHYYTAPGSCLKVEEFQLKFVTVGPAFSFAVMLSVTSVYQLNLPFVQMHSETL